MGDKEFVIDLCHEVFWGLGTFNLVASFYIAAISKFTSCSKIAAPTPAITSSSKPGGKEEETRGNGGGIRCNTAVS